MAKASPALFSFNAGELSPRLEGRVDLDKYQSGCRTLENYLPLVQGGALKRSGLRFIRSIKGSDQSGTSTLSASWSADITATTKFPNDGSDDLARLTSGQINRVVAKFDISAIPSNAVVSAVSYRLNVVSVTNMAGVDVTHGPYNGDGFSEDPESGAVSGATVFLHCNVSGNNYGTAFADYQTTGVKTVSLGAGGIADVQAAIASGAGIFSVASKFTIETTPGANILTSWDEYVDASPPALLVTFTAESRARLIPFEFSTEQAYVLEFGNLYMRVYKDGGQVLEVDKPITVLTNTTPVVLTVTAHGYSNGQEVFVTDTGKATIDDRFWIVANGAANTFELQGSTAPGSAGTVGTVARVYEIVAPYVGTDTDVLAYAQSADVMYLVHPLYEPRKLSRTGHTDWTLTVVPFDWQPFAPENTNETDYMVASSDTGTVTITSTGGHFTADHVGSYVRLREVIETYHAEWKPNLSGGYTDAGYAAYRNGANMIVTDQLFNDGKVYEISDLHGAGAPGFNAPIHEEGFASDGRWDFKFINYGAGYALITALTDSFRVTATVVKMLPRSMRKADISITSTDNLNPVAVTATAHGLDTGDTVFIRGVATMIQINNRTFVVTRTGANTFTLNGENGTTYTDGTGGILIKVKSGGSYTGSTQGLATVPAFPSLFRWSFGAWSAARGYPRAVTFFEDRLWFAGTDADPQTVWGSRTSRYEDFRNTDEDDSSLLLTLNTNRVNVIEWLSGQDSLILGTAGGEFQLQTSNAEPITPGNVRAPQRSTYGCRAGVLPIAVEGPILFAQRAGRKIRELIFDLDTSSLIGADMTILADHLTLGLVKQMAFQSEPDRVLWVILEDGTLLGFTYERAQQVTGWHVHPIGGTNVAVESIAVIPHPDGDQDQLWAIVRRTINGATRRYVEVLESAWLRTQALADAFFVDSGLTYDGTPATTISGLDHLIGESVVALADGVAVGPFTVSASGTITLATAASKVQAKLPYTADLETMRIEAGAPDGTAQGRRKRIAVVVVRLDQTGEGLFMGPSPSEATESLRLASGALFDGDTDEFPWIGGTEQAGRIALRHTLPTPCTITGIFPRLETSGN